MEKVICSVCGKECVPNEISTGYAVNCAGEKLCYECVAKEDEKQLMGLEEGQKMYLYLIMEKSSERGFVTDWPGKFKIPVHYRKGRHNFTGNRYDCYFKYRGNNFHATRYGDMTEICHVWRLKKSSRMSKQLDFLVTV